MLYREHGEGGRLEGDDGFGPGEFNLEPELVAAPFEGLVDPVHFGPVAIGIMMPDVRGFDPTNLSHINDILDTAVSPIHSRDPTGDADPLEAIVFRAKKLAVAIHHVRPLSVLSEPLFGLQARPLPGIVGLAAMPQLVIGAKNEHLSAVLDAIGEAWGGMEDFEGVDLRSADLEWLIDRVV